MTSSGTGVDAFLAKRLPVVTERVVWWEGRLHLDVAAYLSAPSDLPPVDMISNVRAVITCGGGWLLARSREGALHIPGGTLEPGEDLVSALVREIQEEVGCGIDVGEPFGFIHYHHATPKPEGYLYPYPDFFQLVYRADALDWPPSSSWTRQDDWITESVLVPRTAESITHVATIHRPFLEWDLAGQSRA